MSELVTNGYFTHMSQDMTDKRLAILLGRVQGQEIKALSLSNNLLTAQGAKTLASSEAVKNPISLVLNHNPLGDEGAKALAGAAFLPGLEDLQLSATTMGPDGAKALAGVSFGGKTHVSLHDNALGDEGAKALAGVRGLAALKLQRSQISGEGARVLLQTAQVASLELSDNKIGPGGLVGLGGLSAHVRELRLKKTGLTVKDIEALTGLDAPSLEVLNVMGNNLDDASIQALAAAPWLGQLKVLSLTGAKSSPAARQALVKAWGERKGLSVFRKDL